MPALRERLAAAGLKDARTYVQSGNIVLSSGEDPEALARRCSELIAGEFGLDIAVVVRTRDELAKVVDLNPLGGVAVEPKRYQVTFLDAEVEPDRIEGLRKLAAPAERLEAIGRELYSWHPDGVGRSKLWGRIAAAGGLGTTATARNWMTVTTLLGMADELLVEAPEE
jgi:uncharacterized protein (DUF1697 family)